MFMHSLIYMFNVLKKSDIALNNEEIIAEISVLSTGVYA